MKKRNWKCSKCENPGTGGRGYCLAHHAEYMREWRKTHRLEGLARLKMNARSYLHTYIKRGKIEKLPCDKCGAPAQAHHSDYSKPLDVRWLCFTHHHELHLSEKN